MSHLNQEKGITTTDVTASHVTQARVEYESKRLRVTEGGLDLLEAVGLFGYQRKTKSKIVNRVLS